MSWHRGFLAALGMTLAAAATLGAQSADEGREALHAGHYDDAIAALSKVSASDSDWVQAQRDLAHAYLTVGKYDVAENTARKATSAKNGAELENTLGEVLSARGKLAAAESASVRAGAVHASDSLTAALNLAELHFNRGERDRAMKEFDHFIDVYNASAGAALTSEELADVGTAVEYLGARDPELFKDALKAFDRAVESDPSNSDAMLRLGELLMVKYNFADAQKAFDDVLLSNPYDPRALVDAARRLDADGLAGGDSLVRAAFEVNADYPDARIFHAQMLMGLEEYAEAQKDVARALTIDPASQKALAVAAAFKF